MIRLALAIGVSSRIGVKMNAKEIVRYLTLVGEELKAMNVPEPIQLLLVGGGYVLTQINGGRTVTGDIDTVWVYPEFYAGSEVYPRFEMAVRFVASDEDLEPSWLNTRVSEFVLNAGQLPKMRLWRKFDVLHVYLLPKDFILALKLVAAREKDKADIELLCSQLRVNTRKKAQRIIDKYINQWTQENSGVAAKLDMIF